jgi:ABC-type multidrug transport system ATPase subunit
MTEKREYYGGNDWNTCWKVLKVINPCCKAAPRVMDLAWNEHGCDPDERRESVSTLGWMELAYMVDGWDVIHPSDDRHDYGVKYAGELLGGEMLGIVGTSMEQIEGFTQMFAHWKKHRHLQPKCNQTWGNILLDGGCDFYHGIEQLIGYARKTEHFQTACTPREALRFAAAMRAPAKWSKQDKRDHCENVLGQLGLLDCADKLIETLEPLERKLTHIGVELTIKPRLLVVEEANGGGLTPDESLILVTRLAELTWMQDQKMNIIVSFNHASSEVFHKMTKVMVTSPAGQLFYGTPDKLSQQLEGCGYENCHTHLDAIELAKGMQKERLEELCVKMKGNKSWTRVDMDVAFYRAYNPHFYIMMETAARHQQICGIICRQVRTMWRKKLALAMSFFLPAILNILLLLIVSKVDGALNRDVRVVT